MDTDELLTQLKAESYDLINQLELIQMKLQENNQRIAQLQDGNREARRAAVKPPKKRAPVARKAPAKKAVAKGRGR